MALVKKFLFKILRILGILAIVYASLVLYMMLSERRLSFPRAEIDRASEDALKSGAVLCPVSDDKKLQGWILNDSLPNTVLYFADGGEDAATFLANAQKISGYRFVGFNYRGSASSEGTPGEKYYAEDIHAMIGCANSENLILLGHGTGAIAAYNSFAEGLGTKAILVDPAESFSNALSSRYRVFFPEFLSRSKAHMIFGTTSSADKATIIQDDPRREPMIQSLLSRHSNKFATIRREGKSLLDVLQSTLDGVHTN